MVKQRVNIQQSVANLAKQNKIQTGRCCLNDRSACFGRTITSRQSRIFIGACLFLVLSTYGLWTGWLTSFPLTHNVAISVRFVENNSQQYQPFHFYFFSFSFFPYENSFQMVITSKVITPVKIKFQSKINQKFAAGAFSLVVQAFYESLNI